MVYVMRLTRLSTTKYVPCFSTVGIYLIQWDGQSVHWLIIFDNYYIVKRALNPVLRLNHRLITLDAQIYRRQMLDILLEDPKNIGLAILRHNKTGNKVRQLLI